MRAYLVILLVVQFLVTSCKQQEVEFSALDSSNVPEEQDVPTDDDKPEVDDDDDKPVDHFVKKTDTLDVNGGGRTDILFVVDNSSSMRNEQTKISDRFDKFIEKIDGLDWNIAITTTDPRNNQTWSDGKLIPFENGDYYLTSALEKGEAQQLFGKNVQREESGSDIEMGIFSTYRTIERSMNPLNKGDREIEKFLREDAALAVVLVSDEDESGSSDKNKGTYLRKLVDKKWGKKKTFQFNSIIVHTQQCLAGEGATMGKSYKELSALTEGIVGDICSNDYSKLLSDLGKGVADLLKVHVLKCIPQDINNDGKIDISIVAKDGSTIPGFAINKKRLEFDEVLNPDNYEIHYFCAE